MMFFPRTNDTQRRRASSSRLLRLPLVLLLLQMTIVGYAGLTAAPLKAAEQPGDGGQLAVAYTLTISTPATVEEGETVDFVVTLSPAPGAGDTVTVDYTTQDTDPVSAVGGTDYTETNGELTFNTGVVTQTISVDTIDNDRYSGGPTSIKQFEVQLSNPQAPVGDTVSLADVGFGDGTGRGGISDNDPKPQIRLSDQNVNEGNTGTRNININVRLSRASDFATDVDYSLDTCSEPDPDPQPEIDVCATLGEDFILSPISGTLTIPPGATEMTIPVEIESDIKPERNETFSLSFGGLDPDITDGFESNKDQASVTIIDEDEPVVGFSQFPYRVVEAEGPVLITVTLNYPHYETVRVTYFTQQIDSPTSAKAGQDYTTILPDANSVLTFLSGEMTKTFQVTIVNNDILEQPTEEDFLVRLTSPENAVLDTNAGSERPSTADVTIVDDDNPPGIRVDNANQTIPEGEDEGIRDADFRVVLQPASAFDVSVDYTIGGDAKAGTACGPDVDYILIPPAAAEGTLVFPAGTTRNDVDFQVCGNDVDQLDREITIELANVQSEGDVNIAQGSGIATIADDDGPDIAFTTAEATVDEEVGTVDFEVQLSETSPQTVTVEYEANADNSTAEAGADYDLTGEPIIFAPGEQTKSFPLVEVYNDTVSEPDETLQLLLRDPDRGFLGPQITSTLTILDDDGLPRLSFSTDVYTVSESITATVTALFTVTMRVNALPEDRTQEISAQVTSRDGTAIAGRDYDPLSQRLSFGNLEDVPDNVALPLFFTRTLETDILPDLTIEPTERFGLELSNPTGSRLGVIPTAAVDILHARPVGISYMPIAFGPSPSARFSATSYTVNENDGEISIEVALSSPPRTDSSVRYRTSAASAVPGEDYVDTSGVLEFPAGITETRQFSVTILTDDEVEGQQTLLLVLEEPSGDIQLKPGEFVSPLVILDRNINRAGALSGDADAPRRTAQRPTGQR